jgi:DNA invertase Pin-like site-specific DNA recombinase
VGEFFPSGGKLIFHIFGALAEFERNLIRERTQAGLTAARARGKKGGRPRALTARQLIVAQDLYEKRHPIAEICRTLKISKGHCTARLKVRRKTNYPQDEKMRVGVEQVLRCSRMGTPGLLSYS